MLGFDGCEPGANPIAEKYFRDCVYDDRDAIGFVLGLCSILIWLTAQIPQFISNIKNQSSEALSIWFLVEWFAGDTLNLLGCLIQGQQLPTTTILAAYFVLVDVFMLLQYIYYGAVQARRRRLRARAQQRKRHQGHHHSHHSHHTRDGSQQPLRTGGDGAANPAICIPDSESGVDTGTGLTSPEPATPIHGDGTAAAASATAETSSGWRIATAATAAGVSLMCVAALALRPATPNPFGGFASASTHQPHPQPRSLSLSGEVLARRQLLHTLGSDPQHHLDHISPGGGGAVAAAAFRASSSHVSPSTAAAGNAALGGGATAAAVVAAATTAAASSSTAGAGGLLGLDCSFINCDIALVAGTVMGYLSTCFYLASRVSQIRKNLARNSTEGLSSYMFLLTMSANFCTGISIVLRLRSVEQLKDQLPWMCGTFGTIALDLTLFHQAITLGRNHPAPAAEEQQQPHQHHHHHHHHHHRQQDCQTGGSSTHGSVVVATVTAAGAVKPTSDLEAPLLDAS